MNLEPFYSILRFGNRLCIASIALLVSHLHAEVVVCKPAESNTFCCEGSRPFRAAVRHIEGNGIGYKTGYSTLECFFSHAATNVFFPFVDLRGHVFNDGRFAFNTGVGLRALQSNWVYGGNVYYDWRKTKRQTYNQIGLGFECLGRMWDIRANGYIPVGGTKSRSFGPASFGYFSGNDLYVRRKQEFDMYGVNAEAAVHCKIAKDAELVPAAGPYYFGGNGENAYGGQVRLLAKYKEYVSLEGSFSYDNVFHEIFQGQLTLSLPFGKKSVIAKRSAEKTRFSYGKKRATEKRFEEKTCSDFAVLSERIVQPVVRDEIIVVDTETRNFLALGPNGLPLSFFFVSNTSHSAGTFQSPFSTLAAALSAASANDTIYILPGDGTSQGLNAGNYVLQDGQQLLGGSSSQTIATQFGIIALPPLATGGMPILSSPSGVSIVTIANNNTISGLQFVCDGTGAPVASLPYCIGSPGDISTFPPTSYTTLSNLIVTNNSFQITAGAYAIAPTNQGGNVVISNNTITSPDNLGTTGICLFQTDVAATNTIQGNQISGTGGNAGLYQGAVALVTNSFGNSNVSSQVIGNTLNSQGSSCLCRSNHTSKMAATFINNTFNWMNSNGLNAKSDDTSSLTLNVQGNTFDGAPTFGYALYQSPYETSSLCSVVNGNTFTGQRWLSESYSPNMARYIITSNVFHLTAGNNVDFLSHSNATLCLRLLDNQTNTTYNLISQDGTSTFQFEPPAGNVGTINQSGAGTVTNIPANGCGSCE